MCFQSVHRPQVLPILPYFLFCKRERNCIDWHLSILQAADFSKIRIKHLKSLRKQPITKVREYQKKKKQKKLQRFKQIEEEREQEKNKWLSFSTKASKKGIIKKSIFASPDNVKGRVGIGTCGVSGKGMTDYVQAEKYKRGA